MDPGARRRSDGTLHDIDECSHIVVGDRLAVADCLHKFLVDDGCVRPADSSIIVGYDAECRVGFGGQQFDLEVAAEAGNVAEHVGHLGQRVAGNHDQVT